MNKKAYPRIIQFLDDGEDNKSREAVRKLTDAGYAVEVTIACSASSLLVGGYRVVGHTAIQDVVDQIIKSGFGS